MSDGEITHRSFFQRSKFMFWYDQNALAPQMGDIPLVSKNKNLNKK
jgi:hypothetical protein